MSRFLKNFLFWDRIRIENLSFMYNWHIATQHGISSSYSYLHSWKNCWWPFPHSFPIPLWFGSWGRRRWGSALLPRGIVNVMFKTMLNAPQISLLLLRILFESFKKFWYILHELQSLYEDTIGGTLLLKTLSCFDDLALQRPQNLMLCCFLHTRDKLAAYHATFDVCCFFLIVAILCDFCWNLK